MPVADSLWFEEQIASNNQDIYHRLFDATGNAVAISASTDAVRANVGSSGQQQSPTVAMNGPGNYVITWSTSSLFGGGVASREFTSLGEPRDSINIPVNTTILQTQELF